MRKILAPIALLLVFGSTVADAQYPTLKFSGYLQNWLVLREGRHGVANAPAPTSWGFRIRRARIGVSGDLNEIFDYKVILELSSSQNILMDLGVTAKIDPALQLTVGQFVAPAQMYETSTISSANTEVLEVSDLALRTSTTLNLDSYRDVGLMASGTVGMLRYRAYAGNGQGRFKYSQSTGIVARKFGEGLFGGRIDLEPVKNLTIGGHFGRNRQETLMSGAARPANTDRTTYSAVLNWIDEGGTTLRMEYGGGKNNDVPAARNSFSGAYAMLAYSITKEIQVVSRYEWMKVDSTALPAAESGALALGGSYFFFRDGKEIARLQLDYFARQEFSPMKQIDNDLVLLGLQIKF